MEKLQVWAQPWWVNLLVLIPLLTYFAFRRKGRLLSWRQLIIIAIFATAFGFVEAAVVVYLRAAVGLLPGYTGTLSDLQHSAEAYHQEKSLSQFPQSLLTIEVYREAATIVMVVSVALLQVCLWAASEKTNVRAKWLMHATVLHIPVLLGLMVYDKIPR